MARAFDIKERFDTPNGDIRNPDLPLFNDMQKTIGIFIGPFCGARVRGASGGWSCNGQKIDHKGPHVAHDGIRVLAIWENENDPDPIKFDDLDFQPNRRKDIGEPFEYGFDVELSEVRVLNTTDYRGEGCGKTSPNLGWICTRNEKNHVGQCISRGPKPWSDRIYAVWGERL